MKKRPIGAVRPRVYGPYTRLPSPSRDMTIPILVLLQTLMYQQFICIMIQLFYFACIRTSLLESIFSCTEVNIEHNHFRWFYSKHGCIYKEHK